MNKNIISVIFLVSAFWLIFPFQAYAQENNAKILIAYFSHTGNTRFFAERIQTLTGGDIAEIKTVHPYPDDYDSVVDIAREEQDKGFRPEIKAIIKDTGSYDVLFVGYPSWWGTMPMAMFTFFDQNSFKGKIIIPFTTHEGSYFGRSIDDLRKLNPGSTIKKGLAVRGRSVKSKSVLKDIHSWIKELGYFKK